ncbi:MAG: phosphotransferase [Patescibacteria group bacterium]
MPVFFSDQILERKLKLIYRQFKMTPVALMSTSGTYLVWLLKKNNKKYLIKIRRRHSKATKQNFIKEILFNNFLSSLKITKLQTPKNIKYNFDREPEYLLYQIIAGYALSNYFYFVDAFQNHHNDHWPSLTNHLTLIQKNTDLFLKEASLKKIKLQPHYFLENFVWFKKYEKNLINYFSIPIINKLEKILLLCQADFNQNLVLTHGDLNPKNIILNKNQHIGIIDWSDLQLNNEYFDLAFLWLCSWNRPSEQIRLIKSIKNKHLFYLNTLVWLPKFYQLLTDAHLAAKNECVSGVINRQQRNYLLKLINQADSYYQKNISKIIKYAQK